MEIWLPIAVLVLMVVAAPRSGVDGRRKIAAAEVL